jgi:hypothetical protein
MIDLKAIAGAKYRVRLDESATADPTRAERMWLYQIPCKYGFISVHSSDTLAAWTGSSGIIARLVAIPGVKVKQRGDREVRVLFDPKQLDAIADLLQARRKRHLSPDQKRLAIERLAAMREKSSPGQAPDAPRDSEVAGGTEP